MSSSHIAKTIAGVGIAGVAIASAALYNAQQEKDKERNRAKSMAEKAQAEMEKAKFERQKRRGDYTPKGKDGNAKAQFEHMFMIETMYTYVPKHIAMELANLRKALDNSFSAITASRSSNDSVVVFMACFAGIFDHRIRPREEYDEDDNEGWAQGKLKDFVDIMVNDLGVDPNASLGLGSTRLSPAALVVVRKFLQQWSQKYNVLDGFSLSDPVQVKIQRALHVKFCTLARSFDSVTAVGLTQCLAVTFFPTAVHKYEYSECDKALLELPEFTNEMKTKWTITCISKLEEFGLVCTPATTAGTTTIRSTPEKFLFDTRKERETQIKQYCTRHGLPLVELELLDWRFLLDQVQEKTTDHDQLSLQHKSHLGFVHVNKKHSKNSRSNGSSKTHTRERLPSLAKRMQALLDDGSSSNVCIESFLVSNFNITDSFCGKVPLTANSFITNECYKINTKKVLRSGELAVSSTCYSYMNTRSELNDVPKPPPVPQKPPFASSSYTTEAYYRSVDVHNAYVFVNKPIFKRYNTSLKQMTELYKNAGWKVKLTGGKKKPGQLRFPIGFRVQCNVTETVPGEIWESGTVASHHQYINAYQIHLDNDDKNILVTEDNDHWIRKLPVEWDGEWILGNKFTFNVLTSTIERDKMKEETGRILTKRLGQTLFDRLEALETEHGHQALVGASITHSAALNGKLTVVVDVLDLVDELNKSDLVRLTELESKENVKEQLIENLLKIVPSTDSATEEVEAYIEALLKLLKYRCQTSSCTKSHLFPADVVSSKNTTQGMLEGYITYAIELAEHDQIENTLYQYRSVKHNNFRDNILFHDEDAKGASDSWIIGCFCIFCIVMIGAVVLIGVVHSNTELSSALGTLIVGSFVQLVYPFIATMLLTSTRAPQYKQVGIYITQLLLFGALFFIQQYHPTWKRPLNYITFIFVETVGMHTILHTLLNDSITSCGTEFYAYHLFYPTWWCDDFWKLFQHPQCFWVGLYKNFGRGNVSEVTLTMNNLEELCESIENKWQDRLLRAHLNKLNKQKVLTFTEIQRLLCIFDTMAKHKTVDATEPDESMYWEDYEMSDSEDDEKEDDIDEDLPKVNQASLGAAGSVHFETGTKVDVCTNTRTNGSKVWKMGEVITSNDSDTNLQIQLLDDGSIIKAPPAFVTVLSGSKLKFYCSCKHQKNLLKKERSLFERVQRKLTQIEIIKQKAQVYNDMMTHDLVMEEVLEIDIHFTLEEKSAFETLLEKSVKDDPPKDKEAGHQYSYQQTVAKHRAHEKRKNLNIGSAIRAALEKSLKQAAPNSQHPMLMNGNKTNKSDWGDDNWGDGSDETTSEDETEEDESEDEFEKIGSSKNLTVAQLIKDYGYKIVRQKKHIILRRQIRNKKTGETESQTVTQSKTSSDYRSVFKQKAVLRRHAQQKKAFEAGLTLTEYEEQRQRKKLKQLKKKRKDNEAKHAELKSKSHLDDEKRKKQEIEASKTKKRLQRSQKKKEKEEKERIEALEELKEQARQKIINEEKRIRRKAAKDKRNIELRREQELKMIEAAREKADRDAEVKIARQKRKVEEKIARQQRKVDDKVKAQQALDLRLKLEAEEQAQAQRRHALQLRIKREAKEKETEKAQQALELEKKRDAEQKAKAERQLKLRIKRDAKEKEKARTQQALKLRIKRDADRHQHHQDRQHFHQHQEREIALSIQIAREQAQTKELLRLETARLDVSRRKNEIEHTSASNIRSGWNTGFSAPPPGFDTTAPRFTSTGTPPPPGLTTKEPQHTKPESKHEEMVWFDQFIQSTRSEKYRDILIEEECTDQETLKLFSEGDLENMGIKKGARLRMLNFLKFGKRMVKGRPAPRP